MIEDFYQVQQKIAILPECQHEQCIQFSCADELDSTQRSALSQKYLFPSVSIIEIEDVIIGGLGLFIKDSKPVFIPRLFPGYLKQSFSRYLRATVSERQKLGSRVWYGASLEPGVPIRTIKTAIYALHPNLIYGHFLVEILPRLLLLHQNVSLDIPIVLPLNSFNWVAEIVQVMLKGREIITYDHLHETVRVSRIWTIEDVFNLNGFHPSVKNVFSDSVARVTGDIYSQANQEQFKMVYISRSKYRGKPGWHCIENEEKIEQSLESIGFNIVHPQEHSFLDQIAIFSHSTIIVGEYSSAMHGALFSPLGTKIVCLNMINRYQAEIARLNGHVLAHIKPVDGIFRDAEYQSKGFQSMIFDVDKITSLVAHEASI